jgi:site-specific recombinase XerD
LIEGSQPEINLDGLVVSFNRTLEGHHPERKSVNNMLVRSYLLHLQARNLSPRTIKATEEYLRPFLLNHDPVTCSQNDIRGYLAGLVARCRPSTVQTAWRHLKGLFAWLEAEGDITTNPMATIPKPIVPPIDVAVLSPDEVRRLLDTAKGNSADKRRDYAILAIMLDAGLRLAEVTNLTIEDVGADRTLRVFGKGRKWRTVALGTTASTALDRWLRMRGDAPGSLWKGRQGELTPTGVRGVVRRRGHQAGLKVHPHMLRHTFVDNWLRRGGSEVDLARLAGWTTTAMANRYARHRADERAVTAHRAIAPLDAIS